MMVVQTFAQYSFIYKVLIHYLRNSRLIWARRSIEETRGWRFSPFLPASNCTVAVTPAWSLSGINQTGMKKFCMAIHGSCHSKWRIKTCDLPLYSIIYFCTCIVALQTPALSQYFNVHYEPTKSCIFFLFLSLYRMCKKMLFFLWKVSLFRNWGWIMKELSIIERSNMKLWFQSPAVGETFILWTLLESQSTREHVYIFSNKSLDRSTVIAQDEVHEVE